MRKTNAHIAVSVEEGDALTFEGDVLALKYAQNLYGVDAATVQKLIRAGNDVRNKLPRQGQTFLIESAGAIDATAILFIGVAPLYRFTYRQIREFSRDVLIALNKSRRTVRDLLLTIHGASYGLDEREAFESEIRGLIDAVTAGYVPADLRRITIVERDPRRVERLRTVLMQVLPNAQIPIRSVSVDAPLQTPATKLDTVGDQSAERPNVFVAMPFSDDMDDVFHYGIQGAVNASGFLCERADFSTFTGDAMAWVRERISRAALVIADLSGANANVYLEVGYAWGRGKQTLLLVNDPSDLKFDVQGQRCIIYKKIKDLEVALKRDLDNLASQLGR